jgi:hypothetical protein
LGQLTVQLDTAIENNTVTVPRTFGLRDWSGNLNDACDGNIERVVRADLQVPSQRPRRADLLITGTEFNQAVQFFHSRTYLDPRMSWPDSAQWDISH